MLALISMVSLLGTGPGTPPLSVRADPDHRVVLISLGPVRVPTALPGTDHATAYNQGGHDMPLLSFTWPVDGWARGFRLTIRDERGRILSNRLLHHLNVIHRGRPQLVQPVYERIIALGQEAQDVRLPASVGVRLDAGSSLALHVGWANDTGRDLPGVVLELAIEYAPDNLLPRPREIRPVALDVGFQPGGKNSFDLAPGTTIHQREFVIPVSGRLLGLGGHLHEHADSISLVEIPSGRVLATLRPRTDSTGQVLGISQKRFGITGPGLRLRAGARYRVVAVYTNPTGKALTDGGMAVLAGVFMPDDPRQWPVLDPTNAALQADIAMLEARLSAGPSSSEPTHHQR